MKAHESSVGELRGRGRAGTRDMAAGHHRNTWGLGDISLGGYWICVAECVLGMMGPGDAGMSAAVAEW